MSIFLEWDRERTKRIGSKVDSKTHEVEHVYEVTTERRIAQWSRGEREEQQENAIKYAKKHQHIRLVTMRPWSERNNEPRPEEILFDRTGGQKNARLASA